MTKNELAGVILKTLNVFDFLQFVDETYESSDPQSRSVVQRFFQRRHGASADTLPGVLPFAQLPTTLPLLTITVCFASTISQDEWNTVGFAIRPEHQLRCETGEDNRPTIPTVEGVIRIIRNASAHLPDFIAEDHKGPPNVSFETGLVTFFSRNPRGQARFLNEAGFVSFLSDYLRAVRKLVVRKLIAQEVS